MRLKHGFTVAGAVDDVWDALLDMETFVRCLPGASITAKRSQDIDGTLQLRLGPILMSYAGTADFSDVDHDARRLVVVATGRDERMGLGVDATVTMSLRESKDGVQADVVTRLRTVDALPGNLGRGLLREFGHDLWDDFAECLSDTVVPERLLAAEDQPREPLPDHELPPEFRPAGPGGLVQEVEQILADGEADGEPDTPVRPISAARSEPQPATPREIDLLDAAPGPIIRRIRKNVTRPMSRLRRRRER